LRKRCRLIPSDDGPPLEIQETIVTTPLIAIVGVLFFGMGFVALATPAIVPKQFGMTFEGSGDNGRAEIRAVYGGFGVAMAAVLAYALTNDVVRDGIVLTVGAALAGMAGGRVISAILGDRTRFYPNWFYFAIEAIGAAALFSI
jgi:hypothetical protein